MNTTPADAGVASATTSNSVTERERFQKLTESITGTPFRAGNELGLLQNGDEIFPAMLKAILGAQHTIEFATYVYWHSRIATEFANALCERARAGVEVR